MKDEDIKKVRPEAMKLYKSIKRDLLGQIDRGGVIGKHFADLIDDYMELWATKTKLFSDIRENGVRIGARKNESIDTVLKVNGQMMKILDQLGIKPSQVVSDEPEM